MDKIQLLQERKARIANAGKNVRADTHKDNITMQNMLAKNGFVPCGIIHVENGSERIAYQYTM